MIGSNCGGLECFLQGFGKAGPDEIPAQGALVSVESKAIPFFRSGKEMKSLLNSYAHGSDTDTGQHG